MAFIGKPKTRTQTRVLGQDPDPNPGFEILGFLESLLMIDVQIHIMKHSVAVVEIHTISSTVI